MTEAEQAYAAAERLIAEARASGATELSFDKDEYRALTTIPPQIAELGRLTVLDLSGTQVSDLAPLAGLAALTELWLDRTQVSDIAPLAGLTALARLWLADTQVSDLAPLAGLIALNSLHLDGCPIRDLRPVRKAEDLLKPSGNALLDQGLTFKNTAATRADPRIAEIAEIEDPAERARTLCAYLEDWVPPGDSPEAPKPDDLFGVLTEDGRLEVAQSLPTEAERDERLKLVLHERMRAKAGELAHAAGNRFPRLAARARAVLLQVDRPFEQVDLLLLHLEVEDLSAREQAGQEDGDPYPPEVTGPLSDVLRIGPGLTLGHQDVDLLNARVNAFRGQPIPGGEKAAHDALSAVTAEGDVAIGNRLRALEGRMDSLPAEVAMVTQRAVHRNMLWRIGVGGLFVGHIALDTRVNVASSYYQPQIVAFV